MCLSLYISVFKCCFTAAKSQHLNRRCLRCYSVLNFLRRSESAWLFFLGSISSFIVRSSFLLLRFISNRLGLLCLNVFFFYLWSLLLCFYERSCFLDVDWTRFFLILFFVSTCWFFWKCKNITFYAASVEIRITRKFVLMVFDQICLSSKSTFFLDSFDVLIIFRLLLMEFLKH